MLNTGGDEYKYNTYFPPRLGKELTNVFERIGILKIHKCPDISHT